MPIGGWAEAALAAAVFFASHSLPPLWKPSLQRRLSPLGYLGLYIAASLASLTWLGVSLIHAPYLELWSPPALAYWAPLLVMPAACVFLAGALIRQNPLSLMGGPRPFDPARPGLLAWSRHPLLSGLALWGLAHLPPNGALGEVLFFGGLAAFAVLGHAVADRRARRRLGQERWARLAERTSLFPAAALLSGRCTIRAGLPDGETLRVSLVLYGGLIAAHRWVIGASPLPPIL